MPSSQVRKSKNLDLIWSILDPRDSEPSSRRPGINATAGQTDWLIFLIPTRLFYLCVFHFRLLPSSSLFLFLCLSIPLVLNMSSYLQLPQ